MKKGQLKKKPKAAPSRPLESMWRKKDEEDDQEALEQDPRGRDYDPFAFVGSQSQEPEPPTAAAKQATPRGKAPGSSKKPPKATAARKSTPGLSVEQQRLARQEEEDVRRAMEESLRDSEAEERRRRLARRRSQGGGAHQHQLPEPRPEAMEVSHSHDELDDKAVNQACDGDTVKLSEDETVNASPPTSSSPKVDTVCKVAESEVGQEEGPAIKPSPKSRLSLKRSRKKIVCQVTQHEPRSETPNAKRVKLATSGETTAQDNCDKNIETRQSTPAVCPSLSSSDIAPPHPATSPSNVHQHDRAASPSMDESPDIGSDSERDVPSSKMEAAPSHEAFLPATAAKISPPPSEPSSFCCAPAGVAPSDYTPVILSRFNSYISSLRTAQSKVLQRVPWGKPAKSHSKQPAETLVKKQSRTSSRMSAKRLQQPENQRATCFLDLKSGRVVSADEVPTPWLPRKSSEEALAKKKEEEEEVKISSSPEFYDVRPTTVTPRSRKLTRRSLTKPVIFKPRLNPPREEDSSEDEDTPPLLSPTDKPAENTPRPKEKWLTRRKRNPSGRTAANHCDDSAENDKQAQSHRSTLLDHSSAGPEALLEAIDVLEDVQDKGCSSSVIDLTEDSMASPCPPSEEEEGLVETCPMCQRKYPLTRIELHAATCNGSDSSGDEANEKTQPVHQNKVGEFGRRVLHSCYDDIESVSSSEANSCCDTDYIPPGESSRKEEEEGGGGGAQCYPSKDGGFVVDLDSISSSPIKDFKRLSDLPPQERQGFLNQFQHRQQRGGKGRSAGKVYHNKKKRGRGKRTKR